jgi:hypothetical protein
MAKDIFGNTITHDIYGNPLKKKNERQPISKTQKDVVLLKQRHKCAICRKPLGIRIHWDHIKEVCRGGKSTTDNLRAIHPDCHYERHILEKAKEIDKKRRKSNSNNYWINPLTGKKEKSQRDKGIWAL